MLSVLGSERAQACQKCFNFNYSDSGSSPSLVTHAGKLRDAEAQCRKVLDARKRSLGLDHELTLHAMHSLACCFQAQGEARGLLFASCRGCELGDRHCQPAHVAPLLTLSLGEKCHKMHHLFVWTFCCYQKAPFLEKC